MHGGWHILSRLIRKSMIPRLNFFSVRKQVIWKERKWAENPGNSIIRVARDRPVAAEAFSKTAAVRPFLLGGTDHEKPPPLKGPTKKKVFVYFIDFHSLNRKKILSRIKRDDSGTKKFPLRSFGSVGNTNVMLVVLLKLRWILGQLDPKLITFTL